MADPHAPHPHTHPAPRPSRTSFVSSILAIVGFIILAIIVVWGLIHLARLSSPWFASLFDAKKVDATTIAVTAPTNADSGETMTVSWKHASESEGMYAFVYKCETGLSFKVPSADGKFIAIPCGAAFSAGTSTKQIAVLPTLTGTTSVKSLFSIVFMPRGEGTQARCEASTQINGTASEPAPTPKPTPTPTPKPTSGPSDLSVRINSATIDQFGNGVVSFDIANMGSGSTGTWYFQAQLPTSQAYTYFSPAQASLAPGSHITNTLRFTQAINGSVFISVDPSNGVRESNEGNNTASQYLGGGYPIQYQNPNPYPIY